jgi:phosphorylcholine metabolism protein LicD
MYKIIFIIILLIISIIYYYTTDYFTECNYDHLILNKNEINTLKELLLEFIKFANENNIEYFAIDGTLLGSIRQGGLLPFDDDIDIGILNKDIDKIRNYKNTKYFFKKIGFGFKFQKNENINMRIMFIDIMVFEQKNDYYKIINNNFPKGAIHINELYPLQPIKYGDIDLFVPNKYKEYLDRVFPNWDTKIIFKCGHHTKKCIHDILGLKKKIDVNYDNNKYLCYTKL